MNREHKYKDKDEYKDKDKDKDAEKITESLTVCFIFGILMMVPKYKPVPPHTDTVPPNILICKLNCQTFFCQPEMSTVVR